MLAPLERLRPKRELSLWETIAEIEALLAEGRTRRCLSLEGEEVAAGLELYWALRRIGAKRAPVGEPCERSLEELGIYEDLSPPSHRVFSSALELLQRNLPTPLVMLRGLSSDRLRVWAKLEWFNPFSLSIKDRTAASIALAAGAAELGDASSGNFGVALAAIANSLGKRARIYLPRTAEEYARAALSLLGAKVVVEDKDLTVEILPRLREESLREGFLHADQFSSDLNVEAHLKGTAREIDFQARAAGLRVSAVAGSLGTSGHMAAVALYARSRLRARVIAAQPATGERIPGMRRVESGMRWASLLRPEEIVEVSAKEALSAVARVARRDGLIIGPSGGAALAALERLAGELEGDAVVIVPDSGHKYASYFRALGAAAGI